VLPGIYDLDAIRRALADFDCVVILKVAGVIDGVLDALEEQHVADGSVLVSRCGWPDEAVVRDVRSLRGRRLDYFSLLIARRKS
jgi:precorrin-2/cobalt-factor-2 C20-methyltransferase